MQGRRRDKPPVLECSCRSARLAEKRADVTVKGTGVPDGFVTVHDFLATVHPYFTFHREETLAGGTEKSPLEAVRRRMGD